jgi:hypothetical protein
MKSSSNLGLHVQSVFTPALLTSIISWTNSLQRFEHLYALAFLLMPYPEYAVPCKTKCDGTSRQFSAKYGCVMYDLVHVGWRTWNHQSGFCCYITLDDKNKCFLVTCTKMDGFNKVLKAGFETLLKNCLSPTSYEWIENETPFPFPPYNETISLKPCSTTTCSSIHHAPIRIPLNQTT